MSETDLQLGGGYTYQWECSILLALNYFFDPFQYNPLLFDLVKKFLGDVAEIQLEGEDVKSGIDLEDINFKTGDRRILIQVKTKEAEGERWTPTDELLLKALFRFYKSNLFTQQPDDIRFVFLTNRSFNPTLVGLKNAIKNETTSESNEAIKLHRYLNNYARKKKQEKVDPALIIDQEEIDPTRFRKLLSQTVFVEYLSVDEVKANIQAKLQVYGRLDWEESHAILFEHFARQSTQKGGGIVTQSSLINLLGEPKRPESGVKTTSTIPYRSLGEGFLGRQKDLEKLHRMLSTHGKVGITGMGGLGKTQLAVEYAVHHKNEYPHGVFWLNAAYPLLQELAALTIELGLTEPHTAPDQAAYRLRDHLGKKSRTLLIFDNIKMPLELNKTIAAGLIPSELPGRLLFTTRRRDFPPNLQPFEIETLEESPALQLLLRGRQQFMDPNHPENKDVKEIVTILGKLPLALELAAAYLTEFEEVTLTGYLKRLKDEGGLITVDDTELMAEELATQHPSAVTATLEQHWDRLEDPDARMVFKVAGQLPRASWIPIERLSLLCGISGQSSPGRPSPLGRVLNRLHSISLVEQLTSDHLLLHPLVQEYAAGMGKEDLRVKMASNLARALWDVQVLGDQVKRRGIDEVLLDLYTGRDLMSEIIIEREVRYKLNSLLRVLEREAHHLRGWNLHTRPYFFLQQVAWRANVMDQEQLASDSESWLESHKLPYLKWVWGAARESPATRRILQGHTGVVNATTLKEDRQVISASEDCTLRIWDLESGVELNVLKGHNRGVNAVAITKDGRRVISASSDKTLRVWDLENSDEPLVLEGHTGWVNAVTLTQDDRRIISASDDKTLRVWGSKSGYELCVLTDHSDSVNAVSLTNGDSWAISASSDNTLLVWDWKRGTVLRVLEGHTDSVNAVAVTGDYRRVISASDDMTLRIWDMESGRELRVLAGHEDSVNSVALSVENQQVVSASDDRTLRVWDLESGEKLRELVGHANSVKAVTLTKDGQWVVSASDDRTLRVWDLKSGEEILLLEGHMGPVRAVNLTEDGRRAVSASEDGTLRVWNLESGGKPLVLADHSRSVEVITLAGDGKQAVSVSEDGILRVWDLESGEELQVLTGHMGRVRAVALTEDSLRAVSAMYDGTLGVWDPVRGVELRVLKGHTDVVTAVALTRDGHRAVSASSDRTLRVWDLEAGVELQEIEVHSHLIRAITLAQDGHLAVSASDDRTLRVWDLEDGVELKVMEGHKDRVRAVALTEDGRRAISASEDGTLRVWDINRGEELIRFDEETITAIGILDQTIVFGKAVGSVYCMELCEVEHS